MAADSSLSFDPVCGMWLEQAQVTITHTYLGRTYSFCCDECRDLFVRDAATYIILLAHEPGESMGYRCPVEYQAPARREEGMAKVWQLP